MCKHVQAPILARLRHGCLANHPSKLAFAEAASWSTTYWSDSCTFIILVSILGILTFLFFSIHLHSWEPQHYRSSTLNLANQITNAKSLSSTWFILRQNLQGLLGGSTWLICGSCITNKESRPFLQALCEEGRHRIRVPPKQLRQDRRVAPGAAALDLLELLEISLGFFEALAVGPRALCAIRPGGARPSSSWRKKCVDSSKSRRFKNAKNGNCIVTTVTVLQQWEYVWKGKMIKCLSG